MSCGCGCNGSPGGCGGAASTATGFGNLTGVGQTTTTVTTTPTTATNWTPWIIGGLAVAAVGGYFAYEHHKKHGGMMPAQENPTKFKSPGEYQLAVANVLVKQYGFSPGKANAAVNDGEIGWKVAWLYQHNYNVKYAAKVIHNRAKKKLFGDWKSAGLMPLRADKPPYNGPLRPYRSPFRKAPAGTMPAAAEGWY